MKKEYAKPYLAIESFQMDAAIAGSCSDEGKITLNQSLESCTLMDDQGDYYGDSNFGPQCHMEGGVDLTQGTSPICYQALAGSAIYMIS